MAKNKEPDKLAQDAAAALAARMSYGRWKAAQNPVKIEKPPLPSDWRVCPWCGTPFKLKNNRKRMYCEAGCQRAAQSAKDRKRKAERSIKEEESQ